MEALSCRDGPQASRSGAFSPDKTDCKLFHQQDNVMGGNVGETMETRKDLNVPSQEENVSAREHLS